MRGEAVRFVSSASDALTEAETEPLNYSIEIDSSPKAESEKSFNTPAADLDVPDTIINTYTYYSRKTFNQNATCRKTKSASH